MKKALLLVMALVTGATPGLFASSAPVSGDSVAVAVSTDSVAKAPEAPVSGTPARSAALASEPEKKPVAALKPDTAKVRLDTAGTALSDAILPYFEYIPKAPDELVIDRIGCIEGTIPLTYNAYVRQFIDYFTVRNRKYTRTMLERQNVYFPLFERYLAKHNMPDELKYLAVVESGLNPKAVSRTKAMGLWQFMAPTANDYRLVQNQYIDERLDPEKATEAACRFLKALHGMFGDWQVALAAYNCGPGNVRKAIKRAGGKVDFWAIFPYLPLETRGYVPSFIAISYAMNYAEEHNLQPDTIRYAHATDTMLVSNYLDLEKFSDHLCVSKDYLLSLNPALKVSYIPEHFRNYPLRVPAHSTHFIAQNRWWLLDSCRRGAETPAAIAGMLPETLKPQAATHSRGPITPATRQKKTTYTVRRGDVLGQIADKHDVSVTELKKWNRLKTSRINVGQKLIVMKEVPVKHHVASAKQTITPAKPAVKPTEERSNLAAAQTAATKAKPTLSPTPAPAEPTEVASTTTPAKETPKQYQVQPGDTLFNISKRFEGLTVEQIKKLNNLKSNQIKVGQTLILG